MKYIYFLITRLAFLFIVGTAAAQTGITPEQAPKIAGIAVAMVHEFEGIRLDYSPESLKTVDRILLKLHNEGNLPQSVQKTILAFGCYVGEVMVRNLGAAWELPSDKEAAAGFAMIGIRDKKGGFSNPIGKVYKRVQNGDEDSLVWFYDVFSKLSAEDLERVPKN